MNLMLAFGTGLAGLWLAGGPWLPLYDGASAMVVVADAGLGALALLAAFLQLVRGAARSRWRAVDWAEVAIGGLTVLGALALPGRPLAPRLLVGLCGLVVLTCGWLAAHLPTSPAKADMWGRDGQNLMEVTNVVADAHGIGMKGKMLGAMPATVYVRPVELWRLLALVTPAVLAKVVVFIARPNPPAAVAAVAKAAGPPVARRTTTAARGS